MRKKLFFKALCAAACVCVLISMTGFSARCDNIGTEVFRLHILANSDSKADQNLKLRVRDKVLKYTDSLYKNVNSADEAQSITRSHIQKIADIAKSEVENSGYDYKVTARVDNEFFPTRYYGNITMPAGFYDCVKIEIGEGKGHNWWCVMYPAICVGSCADFSALERNTSKDEYKVMTSGGFEAKFWIVEKFKKFSSFFS